MKFNNKAHLLFASAILGVAITIFTFDPFSTASGIKRRLLPDEAAELAKTVYANFGIDTSSVLMTVRPVVDKHLVLFVRKSLGSVAGNEKLKFIPASFWEISLKPEQHVSIPSLPASSAARLKDWSEVGEALIKMDERGRWFQFYRKLPEQSSAANSIEFLQAARQFLEKHHLFLPNGEIFQTSEEPQILTQGQNYHRAEWQVSCDIPNLTLTVAVEAIGQEVIYAGAEYIPPQEKRSLFWQVFFLLKLLIITSGLVIAAVLIIKQLRRDAIDFQLGLSYCALITSPLALTVAADLPTTVGGSYYATVSEIFYILSSYTLLWLIILLPATPIVALNDSLIRQKYSEKMATFDALLRGRFRSRPVGQAVFEGVCIGLASLGTIRLSNAILGDQGDYTHEIFTVAPSSHIAFVWTTICALGEALTVGFAAVFILAILSLKLPTRVAVISSTAIWAILTISSSEQYTKLSHFGIFVIVQTGVIVYLTYRQDLLALTSSKLAILLCSAATEMLALGGRIYFINGLITFGILAAVIFASYRIAEGAETLPIVDYVPNYIKRLKARERLERDIEIARELQFNFLPQELPQNSVLEIATLFTPAHEIGGDYYDFVELGNDRLGVVIADVAGKGIPAAFYMTMVKGIIQTQSYQEDAPADLLRQINRVVYKCTSSSIFITLFYAIIDSRNGRLTYSNAGHNPPLLVSRDGKIQQLTCGGTVLGLFPQLSYDEETIELTEGDTLFMFTDGIIEMTNPLGEEFGIDRLKRIIKEAPSPKEAIQVISEQLKSFSAGASQTDDMTLVIVRFNNG
ncbi:MAG: PP2C family protein-serine/threonine phosphatase [Acidobacteriota bacterium]|nr:PP2C family protein-serine/threonine phosphatase [Blastocatellia bacterium]MDW8411564.1 PP2C family protein-serine/threonine phosphatase [Acidobacteriota bacterium]